MMTRLRNSSETLNFEEMSIDESSPLISPNLNGDQDDDGPQQSAPPKDEFQKVYFVFFLLGMGGLLPWNFFISLNSFWDYKFRNVSADNATSHGDEDQTELQKEFTSMLAIASNVPNATFVILNVAFGQRFDLRKRIFGSLGVILCLFVIVTALARANSDTWQRPFLILILVVVVVINMNSAIFQGGSFGIAGKFPPRYISVAMSGQAVGGIFPALVDLFVTGLRIKPQGVGVICFIIATLVLLMCLVAFHVAYKSPFFQYYYRNNIHSAAEDSNRGLSMPKKIKLVFAHSWQYCLAIYITFTVTLSVFPAVTVLVESQFLGDPTLEWWAKDFFGIVCCFLLFNFGDLIGRCLASWIQMPGNTRWGRNIVVFLSFLRVIFIPLFMYCNASPTLRHLPVFFPNDADYILFMVLFSISNGYLGNLCMIHGPKTIDSSELQETTAMVMVACLLLGTGSGSFLSYPITTSI